MEELLGGALGRRVQPYELIRRPVPEGGELRYLATPRRLARYLAQDLEPVPAAAPFADPHSGGRFAWRLPPAPPSGGARAPGVAFVLSAARAGSTLLRAMLHVHPGLCAPDELHLLPFESLADRQRQCLALGSWWMLGGLHHWLEERQREGRPIPLGDPEAQGLPMAEVYRRLGDALEGQTLVDKTPAYAMHPAWLARAEAVCDRPRYVVLTRDPHPCIESLVRMRFQGSLVRGNHWGVWDDHPWSCAEKCWAVMYRNVLDFIATVPADRVCVVRYEDLVAHPSRELDRLCAFLGVSYVDAMADPYRSRVSFALGDPNFARRHGVDAGLASAWRGAPWPHALSPFTRAVAASLDYQV